jgi:flavin-dependent dehydrogenase
MERSPGRMELKIAIAGAGIVGAYLYRLLSNEGVKVDLFDTENGTKCGLTPCAWGTSRGFNELVEAAGLDPEKYILRCTDHVVLDDVRLGADLMTFDKPELVKDLLRGAEIEHTPLVATRYDRVIDATGVSRAYLPMIEGDVLIPCVQYRIQAHELLENRIKLGGVGYAWCFPLSDHTYHVGCGSLLEDPDRILQRLGWIADTPQQEGTKSICACAGRIRLTAPHYSQPFVVDGPRHGIWGVGEAIGCVAPLAGDGIVPGMKSVEILMNHWDDPEAYTRAILGEFDWMRNERRVVDKLMGMEHLGLSDLWVLKRNARRMGVRIGLAQVGTFIKNL